MSIEDEISSRDIKEILHFTTHRGLVGALSSGYVLSRRQLRQEDYLQNILYNNSAVRPEEDIFFDKSNDWLDYINLSISRINGYFFRVSERWHREADIWWVILAFNSDIATHDGVYFATTNNKYSGCVRALGQSGFCALFAPHVRRQGSWTAYRGSRPKAFPTCEQAEVLYPRRLPLEYLESVYVREGQDYDRVRGWLREFGRNDVSVAIEPAKFTGA